MAGYQASGYQDLEYQKEAQKIANDIQRITQNVGSLQRQLTRNGGGDPEGELHTLLHETEQLARETSRRLKDLRNNILPLVSPLEIKHRRIQGERLTNDFTTALNQLQAAQRTLAEMDDAKLREARARTGAFPNLPPAPGGKGTTLLDLGDEEIGTEEGAGGRGNQQQTQMRLDLRALEEKESAMRQLEEDISDVNQIFRDLATMVHDQGEMVESIESNVENSALEVEEGTRQLAKARKSAISARKRKLCLALTGTGILVFLILIIYWSS